MIRDGDTDPQSARPRGNHLYSVAAIGVTGMKMHIKNGMVFAQKRDIRFFKNILLLSGMKVSSLFHLAQLEKTLEMFSTYPRQSQTGG
ncbi:MAG: hypothetical protein MZV70_31515 [Desulfobacterales bacterium]|nr:hypothetical protein [Desulfobacterales bacterium]